MTNLYGDIELDARGMRALAHPVRLALLSHLQRHGSSTATRLAPEVGASPSVTSWHLRHLAEHGLVRDAPVSDAVQGHGRERWWEAAARGFRFEATDEASAEAARELARVMEGAEGDVVGRWHADVEPHLELDWRRLAGRANTRILATAEELREVEARIEEVLAPFVLRKEADPADVPTGARGIRILRHVLPERDEASS